MKPNVISHVYSNEMKSQTKQEYINSLLRDLNSKATRFKRASDEHDLLIQDLKNIESISNRVQEVNSSDKEVYTLFEIEKYNLNEIEKTINGYSS